MWFDLKGNVEISDGGNKFEISCDGKSISLKLPSEFKPNSMTDLSWSTYKTLIREAADNFAKYRITVYVYQEEALLAVIGDKAKSSFLQSIFARTNVEIKEKRNIIRLMKDM